MAEYENPACSGLEVIERACALAGLVTVYTMERDCLQVLPGDLEELAEAYDSLTRVYRSTPPIGLRLSPAERAIMEKPLGSWSAAEKLNAGWRTECAAVLGWAVGVIDTLAPYDQMVPYEWIQPLTAQRIRQHNVTLRPAEDLDHALTEAKAWHWRARQVRGYFPDISVDTLSESAAARRKKMIARALGEGAHLFGKPYAALSFQEGSIASSIASERHYALNWLWDGGLWDEVTTDT